MRAEFVHLHVASSYSMQYGASSPAHLVTAAAADGQRALALTDRDGLYGAIRFARACDEAGIAPILGVDLAVEPPAGDGTPLRPGGSSLVARGAGLRRTPARGGLPVDDRLPRVTVLARGAASGMAPGQGWAALCRLVTATHLRGERGRPVSTVDLIADHADTRRAASPASVDFASTGRVGPAPDCPRPGGPGESGPAWRPAGAGRQPAALPGGGPGRARRPARPRLRRGAGRARPPRRPGPRRCCAGGWTSCPSASVAIELTCHDGPPDSSGSAAPLRRPGQTGESAPGCPRCSPPRSATSTPRGPSSSTCSTPPVGSCRSTPATSTASTDGGSPRRRRERCTPRPVEVTGDDTRPGNSLRAHRRPRHRLHPAPPRPTSASARCTCPSRGDRARPRRRPAAGARPALPGRGGATGTPGADARPSGRRRRPARRRAGGHRRRSATRPTSSPSPRSSTSSGTAGSGSRPAARARAAWSTTCSASAGSTRSAHGLLMERFCTPLRAQLPDIDIDVESARRTEIYEADPRPLRRRAGDLRVDDGHLPGAARHPRRRAPRSGLPPTEIDAIAKAFPHIRARDARHAIAELPELRGERPATAPRLAPALRPRRAPRRAAPAHRAAPVRGGAVRRRAARPHPGRGELARLPDEPVRQGRRRGARAAQARRARHPDAVGDGARRRRDRAGRRSAASTSTTGPRCRSTTRRPSS